MSENKKKKVKGIRKSKAPIVFIAPALILILLFSIIPIIVTFLTSFTDFDLVGLANRSEVDFIGLANFKELLTDDRFWKALRNTLYYVIIGVPLVVFFSLVIAMGINYLGEKSQTLFRGFYYAPAVTNIVAISVVWMFIYNTDYGILNYILSFFGVEPIGWLTDPEYSKLSLIVISVWRAIGLNMLIMLAALKSIPTSLYEAAAIDGLSRMKVFFRITLPQMSYAIFFVTVTTLIGWFQYFEEPFVITEGGPVDSTMSMALYIYETGFSQNEFGYAAAVSVVLFLMIIVVTAIQMYINKKGAKNNA